MKTNEKESNSLSWMKRKEIYRIDNCTISNGIRNRFEFITNDN